MKHTFLIAITLLALTSSALAVEVTVTTPTKLYDSKGKVLAEVAAGQTFKAERLSDKFVYGFLALPSGGARGWIPLAALDLDEEAKRTLGASSKTQETTPTSPENKQPGDDAVLLRYRLNPGELQVYEVTANVDSATVGTKDGSSVSETLKASMWMQMSVTGKSRAADGTYRAEMQFHRFRFQMDMTQGGQKIRFKGNEEKVQFYLNGSLAFSGKWGAPELSGMPNLSKQYLSRHTARFTDRAELLEVKNLDPSGETFLQGDEDVLFEFTYPEEPIRPGDSWKANEEDKVKNPAQTGRKITLVGQAKHTVLERVMYGNRRCLKIGSEAKLTRGQSWRASRSESCIDEATGIPLSTVSTTSEQVTGSAKGTKLTNKSSTTVAVHYKGNKLNE